MPPHGEIVGFVDPLYSNPWRQRASRPEIVPDVQIAVVADIPVDVLKLRTNHVRGVASELSAVLCSLTGVFATDTSMSNVRKAHKPDFAKPLHHRALWHALPDQPPCRMSMQALSLDMQHSLS